MRAGLHSGNRHGPAHITLKKSHISEPQWIYSPDPYYITDMEHVNFDSLNRTLKNIQKELSDIREHMVDVDSILTEDDYSALVSYRGEKKSGRLVLHESLKKDLGL